MNASVQLIRIDDRPDGTKSVSARELYAFLDVRKDFTDWCKRMFGYGFQEGEDFTPVWGKSTGGRPSQDYALTMDTAKEIAMLQRTERGKQARQYFIEVERRYRQGRALVPALPDFTSPAAAARAWAEEWEGRRQAEAHVQTLAPKAAFYDAVTDSKDCIDMAGVAKVLNFRGVGRTRLFEILREQGILRSNNEPYQDYVSRGWLRQVESRWTDEKGEERIYLKTVAFQKGVDGIRRLLEQSGYEYNDQESFEDFPTERPTLIVPLDRQVWEPEPEPVKKPEYPPRKPNALVVSRTISTREPSQIMIECHVPERQSTMLTVDWGALGGIVQYKPGEARQLLKTRLTDLSQKKNDLHLITESRVFARCIGLYAVLSEFYGRSLEPSDLKIKDEVLIGTLQMLKNEYERQFKALQ